MIIVNNVWYISQESKSDIICLTYCGLVVLHDDDDVGGGDDNDDNEV